MARLFKTLITTVQWAPSPLAGAKRAYSYKTQLFSRCCLMTLLSFCLSLAVLAIQKL